MAERPHQPTGVGERKDYSKQEILNCTCGQGFQLAVVNTKTGHQLKCFGCGRAFPIEIFIPASEFLKWVGDE